MRQPFISAQQVRLCAGGRPTGRWPETGFEEINGDPRSRLIGIDSHIQI
jgi:hypothetical protein